MIKSNLRMLDKIKKPSKRKLDELEETKTIIEVDSIEDPKPQDIDEDLKISLDDIGEISNIEELSMKVNRYIKLVLSQWSESEYSKDTLLDTKKALFPLLVKLRKATLSTDQLTSLLTIFYYVQRTNYLKAGESYMQLSIGNVAWPIGVVNVSIHQRSGQVKLNKGGANIMIDEQTRKWITAVKRLITYKETTVYKKE